MQLQISNPEWVHSFVDWNRLYRDDADKMRLAIALSRENTRRGDGGPFGAAVFESGTGRLVGVGVNSVVRLNNCTLHGEMMAFMMALAKLDSFTLDLADGRSHDMITSCEPCAMCLGAALWSGVRRIVFAARGRDARDIGFDEGPVFAESYAYLRDRNVKVVGDFLRDDAREVLREYARRQGVIYNGQGSSAVGPAAPADRYALPRAASVERGIAEER